MSDILIIDKDLRTITIPDEVTLLGVESDDDVLRLNFQMPKMYGEYDLSTFSARINYVNANLEGDVYAVNDMEVDGDNITFTWLVGRNACKYKGNTHFNVCLKKIDNNGVVVQEFNTQPVSLPVLEGLETTEAIIQEDPDIIEYILNILNGLNGFDGNYVAGIEGSEITIIDVGKTTTSRFIVKENGLERNFVIEQNLYFGTGQNSDGAMTQKAVTDEIDSLAYLPKRSPIDVPVEGTELTVNLMYPNVFYTIGNNRSDYTKITINSLGNAKSNKLNRYYLRINTGLASPTLIMPSSVKIPSFTLEAGKIYDIFIYNDIARVWCDGAAIGSGSGGSSITVDSTITVGGTNPVNSVAVISYINSLDASNTSY